MLTFDVNWMLGGLVVLRLRRKVLVTAGALASL